MQLMFGKDVTMKELDALVDKQEAPCKGNVSGGKGKYGDKVVELNKILNRTSDRVNAKRSVKMVEKLELRLAEQESRGLTGK